MEEVQIRRDPRVMQILALGIGFWFLVLLIPAGTQQGKTVYITDLDDNNAFKYGLFLAVVTMILETGLILARFHKYRFYFPVISGILGLFALNDVFAYIYTGLSDIDAEQRLNSPGIALVFLVIGSFLTLIAGALGANHEFYDTSQQNDSVNAQS